MLHDELDDFVRAGLTPAEALRTATTTAAQFLGIRLDVAPGAPADLLVVDGNPLNDLSALRKPARMILRGVLYQRR